MLLVRLQEALALYVITPNGAGKSTLLYLMGGLLRPQFGSVEFDGVSVWSRQPSTLADIFLVPEEFSLPSVRLDEFVTWESYWSMKAIIF